MRPLLSVLRISMSSVPCTRSPGLFLSPINRLGNYNWIRSEMQSASSIGLVEHEHPWKLGSRRLRTYHDPRRGVIAGIFFSPHPTLDSAVHESCRYRR